MTPDEYFEELRKEGWAIMAITPVDVQGADTSEIEAEMYDAAKSYINDYLETFSEDPRDQFRDDVEADADTLKSAGWGTDEDYIGWDQGMDP